jgi:hypothetical protein
MTPAPVFAGTTWVPVVSKIRGTCARCKATTWPGTAKKPNTHYRPIGGDRVRRLCRTCAGECTPRPKGGPRVFSGKWVRE